MSKTDKTRPWTVKVLDRGHWLVENHDHRNGVCDLPPRPTRHVEWAPVNRGSCVWGWSTGFFCDGSNRCGCRMCTDQDGRYAARRRERREGRRQARDWSSE